MSTIIRSSKEHVNKSNDYLSDLSQKDLKWDYHRSNTDHISGIYGKNKDFIKYERKMNVCSEFLSFAERVDRDTAEIKLKLKTASFCRVRACPVCTWRKALRNTSRFFSKLPELKKEHPTARWLFLTLTVPNCDTDKLRAKIQSMNKGWKRLTQMKSWPALGFVRSIEVTRSATGQAHPHFHCLLQIPAGYFSGQQYIKHEDWLQNWRDCMRDSSITQVDVRAVSAKREGQSIESAIVETLKYATKVEDAFTDASWLYETTTQLKGLRFIAAGGTLKGIFKDELTEQEMIVGDDAESEEDDETKQLHFAWNARVKRYKKFDIQR